MTGANQEWTRFPRTLRASLQVFENSRVPMEHHLADNTCYPGAVTTFARRSLEGPVPSGFFGGWSRASSDARVD